MCGIAGILHLKGEKISHLQHLINVMNTLQKHRGPDGNGMWIEGKQRLGFGHRRLKIIDLELGSQPMQDPFGCTITYNGEIYNYLELRKKLGDYPFRTQSDTETILAAYHKWGTDCVNHLRGMFAFAIWDSQQERLFCSRDRFGIKPFHFTRVNDQFLFASEAKALIPFLEDIKTHIEALKDYLVFQFCLGKKTLFEGIEELPPAHTLVIENGRMTLKKYWEVFYTLDFDHTSKYFEEKLRDFIEEAVLLHTRSDVPIGSYISGGVDSSIIAAVAARYQKEANHPFIGFHGKFNEGEEFDESLFARALADQHQILLYEIPISSQDFLDTIDQIIYHLDFPVAGPGSFPQFHVAKLAAQHRKVVLGGQGGDEIFGGYTRYLMAYFEQCLKAAINGTMHNGNFIVTYESIIPNLSSLKHYQPLLQEFWREGLFETHDKRYFRLINRAPSLTNEIRWEELGNYSPEETFREIFHGKNVGKESYFDSMTHFDFKTLLPALLHVEDRMSMANSLESRVPFLDHPLIEFVATMPSNIKFKDGTLKMVLTNAMKKELPDLIFHRKNKMGFPVPLNTWLKKDLRDFILDIFSSSEAKTRPFFNQPAIVRGLDQETKFGRKIWGLLSLELWFRQFHDQHATFKQLLHREDRVLEPV